MRSAVSVILSSPSHDPNMSHPDFDQTFHDHATLLVLVKHVGDELDPSAFSNVYERIRKINDVKIVDKLGVQRTVKAKYIKDYPVGNNQWGDFQTHRRLLGLITVGKCSTEAGLNEVCRSHEVLNVRYTDTLYDSRSIIFGVNSGPDTPNFTPASNFNVSALYFASDDQETTGQLEPQITEFLTSVFWVLESKRHERIREKIEKVALLVAPFERKEFVGQDMDSSLNRKRSLGRITKHLGDLCLQAGLPGDALSHYQQAINILRSINDLLWLGCACEGLSAASMCIRYPNGLKNLRRKSSFQEKKKQKSEILEPSSLPNIPPPNNVLSNDEICKFCRESVLYYSKCSHAGVIETEVRFKAARVAAEFQMPLQTSFFLQNIIFIKLSLPEEEKIRQLNTLSELYAKIGFHRKASYYQRTAAAKYVSARNPQTNWDECYNLMLKALSGHRLSLDPSDYPACGENGWGSLQKQVLQDVVTAANRVGHSSLATRHMTLLLQVMWSQLSPFERVEASLQLQSIAAQCEGSPIPLKLDSGLTIPPANLIHIPTVESFVVHKLPPPLQPMKLEKIKEDYGPFLFTPLNFGSLERKTATKEKVAKLSYLWVAEEECEVKLELTNPLNFELEVSNMRLLTTGVVFETLPYTVILPPDVVKYPIILTGTPKETGELEITGYSTHTLGVKSNCRLNSLSKVQESKFVIEVVPSLPLIEAHVKLGNDEIVRDQGGASVSLLAGESAECELVIRNMGKGDIDIVEVSVDTTAEQNVLTCDTTDLQKKLPLAEGSTLVLPLRVFAASIFVNSFPPDAASMRSSLFSGTSSFPSLQSYRPGNDHLTTPSQSFRSGPSSLNSLSSQFTRPTITNMTKNVECRIKIRYSGKPGLDSGYCRVAVITMMVDISHSILISNWDVLPAETSSQFYMVLDMMNMTDQEIEIKYAGNKRMIIEVSESCRVPIPVDRCPLSKIGQYFHSEGSIKETVDLNTICSEHIASLVEVEWFMGERSGKASLKRITLSSHMLDIVRMSPINWEISINGEEVNGSAPLTANMGECIQLSVVANNSLTRPLADLSLSVHFFQDYQNGTCNFKLDTRLAMAGPSHLYLEKFEEQGSAKMESSVVFFNPGQYKMNVQCTSQAHHSWKLLPPLEFLIQEA